MPSRLAFFSSKDEIESTYGVSSENIEIYPYYNLKPTNKATGIVNEEGYKLVRMYWGYTRGFQSYKARSETVHEKKLFRKAFAEKRCVIFANGFFEWERSGKERIPHYFSLKNKPLFGIAGIYNSYFNEEESKMKYKCAVLTTEPHPIVEKIFHRMPVIFNKKQVDLWLDHEKTQEELSVMLKPYEGELNSWIVDTLPSKGDNGPETIKPIKKKRSEKTLSEFF
ncbi:MAG: SOS response-associated peptidase [Candidatus Hodarchaeales archaeon]|jgi:putative SOS response-associated peptidase YedK